jgi:hypothetical protein
MLRNCMVTRRVLSSDVVSIVYTDPRPKRSTGLQQILSTRPTASHPPSVSSLTGNTSARMVCMIIHSQNLIPFSYSILNRSNQSFPLLIPPATCGLRPTAGEEPALIGFHRLLGRRKRSWILIVIRLCC